MLDWFDEIKYFAQKLVAKSEDPNAHKYLTEINYACGKIKDKVDYTIAEATKKNQLEIKSFKLQIKILKKLNQELKQLNQKQQYENQDLRRKINICELKNSSSLLKKENALLKYQIGLIKQWPESKKPTQPKKSRLFGW